MRTIVALDEPDAGKIDIENSPQPKNLKIGDSSSPGSSLVKSSQGDSTASPTQQETSASSP
jgi:hypothetical protein